MNQIPPTVWGDYTCLPVGDEGGQVSYDHHHAVGSAQDFGGGALEAGDSVDDNWIYVLNHS